MRQIVRSACVPPEIFVAVYTKIDTYLDFVHLHLRINFIFQHILYFYEYFIISFVKG